ncbi:hypothetical protein PGT21_022382 [Puccinia graminis f. sp. tritici]|uniref:Uncharacterized protein n=1 Tax=Puccinia graminis f. sp. tritici TaxID=56615 RepID=A0A5B0QXZ9_PUCGR|nr:hypothetical protein PGT21_022382 [Puccinia graminis f. sp. tritici]
MYRENYSASNGVCDCGVILNPRSHHSRGFFHSLFRPEGETRQAGSAPNCRSAARNLPAQGGRRGDFSLGLPEGYVL